MDSGKLSLHLVGDAFVDLFCFLENGLPERGGDSRLTQPIKAKAGGSGINTSTHLTSLLRSFSGGTHDGRPSVKLQTALNPNDEYGQLLLRHAKEHGFLLVNCRSDDSSSSATAHCVVIVSDGERSFMSHNGRVGEFGASDVDIDILVESPTTTTGIHYAHIHVAGYFNIEGFWNGKLKEILQSVRDRRGKLPDETSTTISLVPQHDASGKWDGQLLYLVSLLDFLIMNELEADSIVRCGAERLAINENRQSDPIQKWAAFFGSVSPATHVIVTRGPEGAVALRGGEILATQAVSPVIPVDPTGAGDAFVAGFLHGIWTWKMSTSSFYAQAAEWPPEAIRHGLVWGCSAGTCAVVTSGASVPSPPHDIEMCVERTSNLS